MELTASGTRWICEMRRTSALLVGLFAWTLPSLAHAITRCEVLARAQAWVDQAVPYSWDAWFTDPTTGTCCYRSDCSGLVSAVWGLPAPGHTTYSFAGGPWDDGASYVISAAELQPGDALNYPGSPSAGTGHIMLYVSGDFNSGSVEVYEEFDFGNPAVHRWRSINPSIYLPIRFTGIESCNAAPTGWLDAASCESVSGWTQDPDEPDKSIDVHLYFGGPAGSGAVGKGFSANISRADLCVAIGSCEHGFGVKPPLSLFDGQPHEVHAYGIDSAGGANAELSGSPQTLNCTASVPQGIRRHVQNPESLAAWKFDLFWSKLPLSDSQIASLAEATPFPQTPVLVQADDGSPEVWLVDGSYKRHVPDPAAMAAWSFSSGDVQIKPAAEVGKLLSGPPLRPAPVLVEDSSGKADLIDDPFTKSGTGGNAGSGGSTAGGGRSASGGQGTGSAAANDKNATRTFEEGGEGCGCRVPRARPFDVHRLVLLAVGVLMIALRRKLRIATG